MVEVTQCDRVVQRLQLALTRLESHAWEAAVLPLNYTRFDNRQYSQKDVSLPVLMWANTS